MNTCRTEMLFPSNKLSGKNPHFTFEHQSESSVMHLNKIIKKSNPNQNYKCAVTDSLKFPTSCLNMS